MFPTNIYRFGLQEIGFTYPGLSTFVKSHLWNSMGLPTLLYGMEFIALSNGNSKKLSSTQGSHVKCCLGTSQRSHHTRLCAAAGVPSIESQITSRTASLYHRLFQADTPTRDLNLYFISNFVANGHVIAGTLISQLCNLGLSPSRLLFNKYSNSFLNFEEEDAITDSLSFLIHSDNFAKPWCTEHILVRLLTAF